MIFIAFVNKMLLSFVTQLSLPLRETLVMPSLSGILLISIFFNVFLNAIAEILFTRLDYRTLYNKERVFHLRHFPYHLEHLKLIF